MFVCVPLRKSVASPLHQRRTIFSIPIVNRWHQVVFGWTNFVSVIYFRGIAPTGLDIYILDEEGLFFIYLQQSESPNMYRPSKCYNAKWIVLWFSHPLLLFLSCNGFSVVYHLEGYRYCRCCKHIIGGIMRVWGCYSIFTFCCEWYWKDARLLCTYAQKMNISTIATTHFYHNMWNPCYKVPVLRIFSKSLVTSN